MSGVVIEFSEFANRRRRSTTTAMDGSTATVAPPPATGLLDFRFWEGASGSRYVHHVYSLIGCPQLPPAVYLLVGIEDGARRVLHVGRIEHDAASLNLAEIRQRGASLGATEVHVHLLAATSDRAAVAADLAAALMSAGHASATG